MLRERQVQALRGEFAECLRPGVNFDTVSWVDGSGVSPRRTREASQEPVGAQNHLSSAHSFVEEVHTRCVAGIADSVVVRGPGYRSEERRVGKEGRSGGYP